MTKADLRKRIKGLAEDEQRRVVCALIGHSKVISQCFGYLTCERCDEQIGDTLGGAADASANVLVGHDCPVCRKNVKTLTWRDTFMLKPEATAHAKLLMTKVAA